MNIDITKPKSIGGRGFEIIETDIISLIKESHILKSKLRVREEDSKKSINKIYLDVLEIMDSFERVFGNIEPKLTDVDKRTKTWIGNFKSIKRLLEKILKEAGVAIIEAPDGKAVPGFHHILETRPVEGLEENVIIEERLKGYLRYGEVLRKSEVITVNNSMEDTCDGEVDRH